MYQCHNCGVSLEGGASKYIYMFLREYHTSWTSTDFSIHSISYVVVLLKWKIVTQNPTHCV